MNNLYTSSRSKSHTLYKDSAILDEVSFYQQIQRLADSLLPPSHYAKEIRIDPNALELLTLENKYEIFQLVREALTNVIKHAKANRVSVSLHQHSHEVLLEILDNGRGFNPSNVKASLGLNSMKERIERMDGVLKIDSDRQGTRITARFFI